MSTTDTPRKRLLDFIEGHSSERVIVSPLDSGNWTKGLRRLSWELSIDDPALVQAQLDVAAEAGYAPVIKFETGALDLLTPEQEVLEETSERRVTRYWYSTPVGPVAWTGTAIDSSHHVEHEPLETRERVERMLWIQDNLADLAAMRRKVRALSDLIGERGLFCLNLGHPFFALAELDTLIYMHYDDPGFIREKLESTLAFRRRLIDAACDEGVKVFFVSGISRNMLSPEMIAQWVVPCAAQMRQWCHERGAILYLHDCGKMKRWFDLGYYQEIRPDWLEGCDAPPVGDIDDLAALRRSLPEEIVLKGNLNMEFLARGKPDEVEASGRKTLASIKPYRHILGGACSILKDTPIENIRAMVRALAGSH